MQYAPDGIPVAYDADEKTVTVLEASPRTISARHPRVAGTPDHHRPGRGRLPARRVAGRDEPGTDRCRANRFGEAGTVYEVVGSTDGLSDVFVVPTPPRSRSPTAAASASTTAATRMSTQTAPSSPGTRAVRRGRGSGRSTARSSSATTRPARLSRSPRSRPSARDCAAATSGRWSTGASSCSSTTGPGRRPPGCSTLTTAHGPRPSSATRSSRRSIPPGPCSPGIRRRSPSTSSPSTRRSLKAVTGRPRVAGAQGFGDAAGGGSGFEVAHDR